MVTERTYRTTSRDEIQGSDRLTVTRNSLCGLERLQSLAQYRSTGEMNREARDLATVTLRNPKFPEQSSFPCKKASRRGASPPGERKGLFGETNAEASILTSLFTGVLDSCIDAGLAYRTCTERKLWNSSGRARKPSTWEDTP